MRFLAVIAIILLPACSKEAAVSRGLTDAGVPAQAATCMAREMSKRLSSEQLRKLGRIVDGSGKTLNGMSVSNYIDTARRVGDAEVVLVTGAVAAYCNAL